MGLRSYKGPVANLEQAVFADMPVRIACKKCGHIRQMHAFRLIRLIGKRVEARRLPLRTPIDKLLTCRKRLY
jgi:hypothetical protein